MASILIVDDQEDARDSLSILLQDAGHEVAVAQNGREALAAVFKDSPDVVLLDLLMPVMDGASFLEVIRSYLRFQSLPVVVLTALTEGPLIDRVRAAKVNSILLKGTAAPDNIRHAVEEATAC